MVAETEETLVRKALLELGLDLDPSDLDDDPAGAGQRIKQAYRRLALAHHPDKRAGGAGGEDDGGSRFKRVSAAYELLRESREKRRRRVGGGADFDYDEFVRVSAASSLAALGPPGSD